MKTLFSDIVYAVKAMIIHFLEIIGAIRYFFINSDYDPEYSETDEMMFNKNLSGKEGEISSIFIPEKAWWRKSYQVSVFLLISNPKINPADWWKINFILLADTEKRWKNCHFKIAMQKDFKNGSQILLKLTPTSLLSNMDAKKLFKIKSDIKGIVLSLKTGRNKFLQKEGQGVANIRLTLN